MDKSKSNQINLNRLAPVAPVIRGLLANPTGNEDIPYEPVILKSLTNKEAVDLWVETRREQEAKGKPWSIQQKKAAWDEAQKKKLSYTGNK